MLHNFYRFRMSLNWEEIRKTVTPKDFLKNVYSRGYYHCSSEGHPINIELIGKCDVHKFFTEMTQDEFNQYFIASYERMLNIMLPLCSKKAGRRIDKVYTVLDLKGVALTKIFDSKFKKFLGNITNISGSYYPELLKEMYIINAPLLFTGIWNLIKHTIDPKTRSKIHIISGNGSKQLSKFMIPSKTPHFFGGQCQDPLFTEPGLWVEELSLAEKE